MRKALGFLVLVVILLAAVACEEGAEEATPTAVATATATATAAGPSVYPLTITDMLGRTVTIPAKPERVVATSPTALELVYAVGGQAVARDESARYPPEAQDLPTVGRAYALSFEAILAQKPDLIVADSVNQARFVKQLEDLGVPVLMVGVEKFEDALTALKVVGQVLGHVEEAEKAVVRLSQDSEDLRKRLLQYERPTILILIMDADRNIYAAKPSSYPGALAALLNAVNPTADLPDSGPFPGYALLSPEEALRFDPDVILTLSPAPPPAPRLSEILARVPGYSGLRAVKEGKVFELDVVLFLQAPGPRVIEAMRQMAQFLYPEAF